MDTEKKGVVFGKIAVKKGYVSKGDLKECIRRRKELAEGDGPAPSLKKILVEAGYVSEEQADEIEQMREKVTEKEDISGYEFHEKLGDGATGAVYKATQLSLDRTVAIKVLYPSVIEDESYLDRFYREARTVAQLNHNNIIQGIDVGEENGRYYFVMEYVDGRPLDEIIEEQGKISEERAVEIGLQMARALKHAEDNDLIHRDVKPENIMIDREGTAKLCDLGLARKMGNEDSSVTQMGVTLGTPHYMSPEQATGEELDIRTDVYALGASLYHAVTGEVPFEADAAATVMTKHVTEELEPPKKREPSLSNEFNAVIKKMMEKDPDDRYTPDELSADFKRLQEGKPPVHAPVKIARSRSSSSRSSSRTKRSGGRHSRERKPSGSGSGFSWGAVAGVLLFALAGYVVYSMVLTGGPASVNTTSDGSGEHVDDGQSAGSDGSTGDGNKPVALKEDAGKKEDEKKEGADPEKLEAYENLKKAVSAFEGDLEETRSLNNRITGLLEKTNDEQLKRKIRTLRENFLERRAKRYYKERIKGNVTSGTDLTELAGTYEHLNNFPDLYKNTSVSSRVQKKKTSIKKTIRNRLEALKNKLRQQVENKSFSKAEETFRKLEEITSRKMVRNLIDGWKDVRKKYLLAKSTQERDKLYRAVNLLHEFKRKFRQVYPLSEKSILQVSDSQAKNLIDTYAGKIPLKVVKSEVEAYREDVGRLSDYRNRLKNQFRNMISNGTRISVSDNEDDKKGKLVELNDHMLKIRRNEKTTIRSLASFGVERRISIVNRTDDETEARDAFTFGLVSYLAGRTELARSWLEKASESGFDRANHYLDEIEQRALPRREREARDLIRSLEWAKRSDMELARAHVISDLEAYRYTDQYIASRTKIHNVLKELKYDPLEFVPGEGTSAQRRRASRMLSSMRKWYNGEFKQGSRRGTVKLTYDFSKMNQVSDWERMTPSGMKIKYDNQEQAMRFAGNGLLLHDVGFAGRVHLRATVETGNRVRNAGGVVMWTKKGGYRGMVNWSPPGNASGGTPNVIPAVLQKFQIPSQNGNLNLADTRMKNLSNVVQHEIPGKNTAQIGLRYNYGNVRLAIDGQEVSSARDEQFTRGRSGLLFQNARGRIREITITGNPDGNWYKRKLKKQETAKDLPAPDVYWPLDEDGSDVSGNGVHGTLKGNASIVGTSKVGSGALALDGDGDYLALPHNDLINTGDPVTNRTISAWFKVKDPSITSRKQVIWEEGEGIRGLNIYVYGGKLYAGGWNTAESNWHGSFLSPADVQADTWHHVAITLNANKSIQPGALTGYLDGKRIDAVSGSQIWNHPGGVAAGAVSHDSRFHDVHVIDVDEGHELAGKLDDLRLYNRTLGKDEIQALYNATGGNVALPDRDASSETGSGGIEPGTFEGPLEYQDVNVGEVAFAINLGGDAVQTEKGSFQKDPYTSADRTSRKGTTSETNESISAKKNKQIFRTQRNGAHMSYVFPLANGRYNVTLYFVEKTYAKRKKRLFNVFLQENRVLNNFDVYAESGGKNRGITKTFRNVPVGNKRLYLDLTGVKRDESNNNATIAGVSIKRTRKIESTTPGTVLTRTAGRSTGNSDRAKSDSTSTGTLKSRPPGLRNRQKRKKRSEGIKVDLSGDKAKNKNTED